MLERRSHKMKVGRPSVGTYVEVLRWVEGPLIATARIPASFSSNCISRLYLPTAPLWPSAASCSQTATMSRRPPKGEYIETVRGPSPKLTRSFYPGIKLTRSPPGYRQQGRPQGEPRRHPEHHARRQDRHPARGYDSRRLDAPESTVLDLVRRRRTRQQHRRLHRAILFP